MQNITVTCTPPNVVIRSGELRLTRAMSNAFAVTLVNSAGSALDLSAVAAWELGITDDFLAATGLLAATTAITAAENVLTIALNGHTVELAEYLDGKKTAAGFATLLGYSGGVVIASYVWPVVLQNVGYDGDTVAATAIDGLFYTAAAVDAKFADIAGTVAEDPSFAALLTAKEDAANKTQAVDAEDPSADRFPSEAALVDYVEDAIPVIPPIPTDISDLSDEAGILDAKVDVVAGKGLSTNDYTTAEKDKVAIINNATLATLSGADVSVAPWGRYYWSAAGTCTLTVSGFGASGLEYAVLLLDVAEDATVAVSGATVAEDDAITAAGQYMVYLINQGGTVHFRVASFTEAA